MRVASKDKGGFTLIEVLVALFIVSLGMLGVIEAVSQTAGNATRMRDRTIAHWVAMNRLTEVRLQQQPPNIAKTSDEVEMAGRRWRWTMEVSETAVETMRRIDISVAEADSDRTVATLTGFYGSALGPAGMRTPSWDGAPAQRRRPGQSDEPPQDEDRDGAGGPPPQGEPVDPPPQQPESPE
jgi:general secretion pathway protein I